jgi:hypothetical protein
VGKSTIRFTNLRRLEAAGDMAPIMIRLMVACNDLTLVRRLAAWHGEQPGSRKRQEIGTKVYLIRLQIAHIFEALDIIESIRVSQGLMDAVRVCDSRTQQCFDKAAAFLGARGHIRTALSRWQLLIGTSNRRIDLLIALLCETFSASRRKQTFARRLIRSSFRLQEIGSTC